MRMAGRLTVIGFSFAALLAGRSLDAAGPRFWRIEGSPAFLEGEIHQLALDSLGRLRLGTVARLLHDPVAPSGWAAVRDREGALFLGTGNSGQLVRFDGKAGATFFDADELGVHALAVAPDGSLFAATSPDGAVYKLDRSGRASPFFDPEEKYIWALTLDAAGRLFVATGGGGRIYRVEADGRAQLLLTSTDTHVLSLALDRTGRLYAGSAPEGIVYRIERDGRASVLHDSAFREIRSLDASEDDVVYAAAVEPRTADAAPRPPAGPPAPSAPAGGATLVPEVTVSESFVVMAQTGAPSAGSAPTPAAPGSPRGAVLRIGAAGDPETIWTSTEDVPYVVLRRGADLLVGTGNKGKLYRLTGDRDWTLLATLPAEQVTALLAGSAEDAYVLTSNPARLYHLDGAPAARGSFISGVKDAESQARWGAIRFEGRKPPGSSVELSARAGSTEQPDATWTDWWNSGPDADPPRRGRFLQIRAVLAAGEGGESPVIEALTAAYLQRNLPPEVTAITLHPPGEAFQKPVSVSGDPEILGLDVVPRGDRTASGAAGAAPPAVSFSRKVFQRGIRTVSWQGTDPNGDSLLYEVQYRAVGDDRWRSLRTELSEPVLAWDTSAVPNGRYVLRISATDAADNPPALALAGSAVSASFEVDNAPPTLSASLGGPGRLQVKALVRDESSVARLEVSVDGGRWEEAHPRDGIADSREEQYEIPLPASPAPRIVMLRATDVLGNLSTVRVDVP